MADTSKANVLILAPELSTIGSDLFSMTLDDVAAELTVTEIREDMQEKAQRYLTAHLLSVGKGAVGNFASQSVGRVSVSYSPSSMFDVNQLQRTKYGLEFSRIWKKYRLLNYA